MPYPDIKSLAFVGHPDVTAAGSRPSLGYTHGRHEESRDHPTRTERRKILGNKANGCAISQDFRIMYQRH